MAIRDDHKRRLTGNHQAAKERKEARQARKSGRKPAETRLEPVPGIAGTDGTKGRAAAILAEQPEISGSELGRQLGRSPRLGRKLKAELVPELSGNGKGPVGG